MRVYEKNNHWYFEGMIKGKRYHNAISEATCKKDAELYVTMFKADLLRGKLDLVENIGCKLFKELADEYLKYAKANNRSYDTIKGKVTRFKEIWGNKQLKDISPIDIERYKVKRKSDKKTKEKIIDGKKIPAKYISTSTINRDIEVLRKMFNIAIANNWLNKNPCTSVKKFRQENRIERYLTPKEETELIAVCNSEHKHLKNIIRFALNTAMRKGEILGLTWKCVNFGERKITLIETKNGKKRYIPINSVVLEILKEEQNRSCCEYVFYNSATQTRYSDLKRAFNSVCKKANISNFRFHDLRHTAATRMVAAGVPITTVKDILGHSDIHTTMRYSHAITEYSLNAMETLSTFVEKSKNIVPFNSKAM